MKSKNLSLRPLADVHLMAQCAIIGIMDQIQIVQLLAEGAHHWGCFHNPASTQPCMVCMKSGITNTKSQAPHIPAALRQTWKPYRGCPGCKFKVQSQESP